MPDNTIKEIKAISNTDNEAGTIKISNTANYATYTVLKNGTYKFTATNTQNETSETTIIVKNIEKFAPIEKIGLDYSNDEKKAYNYKGANVPRGYYVDTRSNVDTGLVVTDEIDSEGYSIGNEWVWVPVNSEVENNDYYYEETGTMRWSGGVQYTKYSKTYNFVTDSETGETTRTLKAETKPSSGLGEPTVINWGTFGEKDHLSLIYKRGTTQTFDTVADVATQYVDDYNDMINSVDKYEGFYIGRYELANIGGVAKEQPGESLTNENWYYLYSTCLNLGKENAVSGMIYGNLWDATMQWLSKSNYKVGETQHSNITKDTVSIIGDDVVIVIKSSGIYKMLQTGQTSYTRCNNIYDLSGNCEDWTQENLGENVRNARGGGYRAEWDAYASARNGLKYPVITGVAARPHFFIK